MTLDDRLEHYQDENIKNVNKLMTSKTPDWAGTYEEEKKNLTQAILSDLLELIGENEHITVVTKEDINAELDGGNNVTIKQKATISRNKLRQELREKVKKYCE